MSKATYHHGTLKDALLAAGEEVLADCGLKGFTLRECARRAGVSHAAPKHHFGDVTGFLTEIAANGFDRLRKMLVQEITKATSLEEEFIATTRAYVAFAEQNPEHFRIMFRADLLDETSPRLEEAAANTFAELTNVILRQRGEDETSAERIVEEQPVLRVIDDIAIGWCHIHGLAHLRVEQQLSMVSEPVHDEILVRASVRLSRLMQKDAGVL